MARDLMHLRAHIPIQSAAVAKDFSRWLQENMEYLDKHPEYVCAYVSDEFSVHDASVALTLAQLKLCRAVLQLAVDAPTNTLVAKHAADVLPRPRARLLTKELDWPALTSTLLRHDRTVRGVAISPDGLTIVSCSEDKTVR